MTTAQPRLARALHLPDGERVTLRPIGPRDASVLQAYVRGLSPESCYNRFFGALYELPPAELDRVIHLDRKYELALLAEAPVDGAPIVIGEARYALTPDRLRRRIRTFGRRRLARQGARHAAHGRHRMPGYEPRRAASFR